GVEDDAGRIDHRLERRLERLREPRRRQHLDARDDRAFGAERRVAVRDRVADGGRRRAQRVHGRVCAKARFKGADRRPLAELVDRRDDAKIGHAVLCYQNACMTQDRPKTRPLERFWPYADLPEQLTDEERAALDPDLHEALFGAQPRPFSITIVFPPLEVPAFARARAIARAAAPARA